jgi:hypothetical protein
MELNLQFKVFYYFVLSYFNWNCINKIYLIRNIYRYSLQQLPNYKRSLNRILLIYWLTYCREQKILVVNVISKCGVLDCHKLKKKSLPDYAHVNKMSKKLIYQCQWSCHVIQHDSLCYLRPFENGAFFAPTVLTSLSPRVTAVSVKLSVTDKSWICSFRPHFTL